MDGTTWRRAGVGAPLHRNRGTKVLGRTMGIKGLTFMILDPVSFWLWFLLPALAVALILRSAWFKGKAGEFLVNAGVRLFLDKDHYHLIKNVTLPVGGGTTQIDQLLISPYGLFVIETKNMKGWIFGRADQAQWTQQIFRHKQRFQNPLRQNYKHVKSVQELLGLEPNQVHSVVVFVGNSTFKTPMPEEVVHGIFALAKFIKSKRVPVLARHELPGLIDTLLHKRLQPSLRTELTHVRNVKSQTSNNATGAKVCPRCGEAMVERTNRRSGERFLGCKQYPRCRGTRPLP